MGLTDGFEPRPSLASGLTAVVLLTMFRLNPGAAELLEGVAMLLASAVLFWVSYWIISKAEADRWQRFIRGKVERALATGSGRSLAAASFLAVYREGFETILFYQALLASAPAGRGVVPLNQQLLRAVGRPLVQEHLA